MVALGSLPILYSFRRCPYAMRARLALLSSGLACELREVALRNKPAHLLEISPKGTVPVLLLPDGRVLEQSLNIMLWALEQRDPQAWMPNSLEEQTSQLSRIVECDGPFKANLDRYKYPNRYALPNGLQHRIRGAEFLGTLNAALGRTPYLSGAKWGLPDAAIAPLVRQWAHTDPLWFASQPWHFLQVWLQEFECSEAFTVAMVKLPVWVPEQAPLVWPEEKAHSTSGTPLFF